MTINEQALTFECEGDTLVGVLHGAAVPGARRGVLIVVGGPQYRAGSHREFTLLARNLAGHGVPVLRFDYRGMGDSAGAARTFEHVDTDVRCAIDRFFEAVPGMTEVVLWGLCDAASATLFYAHRDPRVTGIALVNPWVHTERGKARTLIRHYYARRVLDPALWRKIGRGEFGVRRAAASFWGYVRSALGGKPSAAASTGNEAETDSAALSDRMKAGLDRFPGRVLLILSGNDFVAHEFRGVVDQDRQWQALLGQARVTRRELPEANHTFARREWRDQVASWTERWLFASAPAVRPARTL